MRRPPKTDPGRKRARTTWLGPGVVQLQAHNDLALPATDVLRAQDDLAMDAARNEPPMITELRGRSSGCVRVNRLDGNSTVSLTASTTSRAALLYGEAVAGHRFRPVIFPSPDRMARRTGAGMPAAGCA